RRAHLVHVPSSACRVDERKDVAAHLLAAGREVLVRLNAGGLLLRVVPDWVERVERVLVGGAQAADRGARADAAGIEPDQVEPLIEVEHPARRLAEVLDAGRARTAWVR